MMSGCIFVIAVTILGVASEPCVQRTIPVRLSNYGPTATNIPVLNTHVRTRTMERLPLRTAGCVPRPRTVANTCTCIKTIVKPQVHNQIISVPSVQRIIQTTATPVVEKIHYHATPVEPAVCALGPGVYPRCLSLNGFSGGVLRPGCGSFVSIPACPTNAILI